MKNNIIQKKTYDFSVRIIHFYKYLVVKKKEYILGKQILKSGTSIGANVEEALGGQSTKDFLAKLSIAYKEARETHYWLRLIKDALYSDSQTIDSLLSDINEIIKIIGSIQCTVKRRMNVNHS